MPWNISILSYRISKMYIGWRRARQPSTSVQTSPFLSRPTPFSLYPQSRFNQSGNPLYWVSQNCWLAYSTGRNLENQSFFVDNSIREGIPFSFFFFFAISFFCKNPKLITSNYMNKCRMLLRLLSYNSDYLIIRRYMIKIIYNFTIKLRNEAREIIIF